MSIKVSVVIPTYQRTDLLLLSLDSLSKQTMDPSTFEVIAIDDASPNGDLKKETITSKTYPFKFIYLIQSKGGPAKARNLGVQQTIGKIIAFLDDDTLTSPTWLATLVESLENSKYQGLAGKTLSAKVKTLAEKLYDVIDHGNAPLDLSTQEALFFPTVNAVIYKNTFEAIGGFDENFTVGEDMDLGFRLRNAGHLLGSNHDAIVYHHQISTIKGMFRNFYGYGRGHYQCQLKHKDLLYKLHSHSDTTMLNFKKITKHVRDYFSLYWKGLKSPQVRFYEALIIPNLHLINFSFYILGRFSEAKKSRRTPT